MLRAKARAAEKEHQGRAWLAWHVVALDRMKRFPKLADLTSSQGPKPSSGRQSGDEIDTTMRRWRAVMAQVEIQDARPSRRTPKS